MGVSRGLKNIKKEPGEMDRVPFLYSFQLERETVSFAYNRRRSSF